MPSITGFNPAPDAPTGANGVGLCLSPAKECQMRINGLDFDSFSEIVRSLFCNCCLFDRVLVQYFHAGHDVFVTANLIALGIL